MYDLLRGIMEGCRMCLPLWPLYTPRRLTDIIRYTDKIVMQHKALRKRQRGKKKTFFNRGVYNSLLFDTLPLLTCSDSDISRSRKNVLMAFLARSTSPQGSRFLRIKIITKCSSWKLKGIVGGRRKEAYLNSIPMRGVPVGGRPTWTLSPWGVCRWAGGGGKPTWTLSPWGLCRWEGGGRKPT